MKTFIYQNKTYEIKYGAINHLIPHEIFHCGLSVQALGLVTYIFSLPKAWRFCIAHLSKQMKISPNSCRKYLGEIFSNPTCREVFKVQEIEASMFDLEEGVYSFKDEETQQGVELWSSMLAKDVSKPNRKRVLVFQTPKQKYLLNLCFKGMDCHASTSALARNDGGKLSSRADEVGAAIHTKTDSKTVQNLSTIKRDSKESLKDSSSKRTREKSSNDLTSFLDLQSFNQNEQEAIKLWIRYKQESTRKPFKPSQIDFQLRKITKLKEQGQDICAVIEKSLDMGWQGLFAMPSTPQAERFAMRNRGFQGAGAGIYLGDNEQARAAESTIYRAKLTPKMPKNIGAKALLCVK